MWRWLEQYFTFTRGEKNAILLLVFLSIAILILPKVYFFFKPIQEMNRSPYEKEIQAFIEEYQHERQMAGIDTQDDSASVFNPYANLDLSPKFKKKDKKVEYFEFDPNKIGMEDWVNLGFTEKQAECIEKLKSKGYKFQKPEDLKKVYVVSEKSYMALLPFIRIDSSDFAQRVFPKRVYPEKPKRLVVLNINTADSAMFEMQRGIGPVLSRRIVQYRSRLGGFVTPEQIREVWGMPDSVYESLKDRFVPDDDCICRIKINSADFETLRRHPYITFSMAKLIIAYRRQHGNFKETADILKIPVFNDSIYQKLAPYLSVE